MTTQNVLPSIKFLGVSIDDDVVPHIWTTTKQFKINFCLPTSSSTTTLECKLFGIQRSKYNEDRYTKIIDTLPEDDHLVCIGEDTLLQPTTSLECSTTRPNSFLFLVPPFHSQMFELNFELARNHWERMKKEKFMMFVLKVVVNEKYSTNVRIYAQKTTPHRFSQATEFAVLVLKPITFRNSMVIQQESTSPNSSSPEMDDSFYEVEKRGAKRPAYEQQFVLDMSPLPQELIRLWSNAEGVKMFLRASLMTTTQTYCIQGECMQSNSFDVQQKRIRVSE